MASVQQQIGQYKQNIHPLNDNIRGEYEKQKNFIKLWQLLVKNLYSQSNNKR